MTRFILRMLLAFTAMLPAAKVTAEATGPNVVWILLDACRAKNLSCYGYERPTSPNIDKLAARGVVFEQHFSQSCRTATSVPSYMTGRYFATQCLGWRFSNATLARKPPAEEVLFPAMMRENGYRAAMFSSAPLFKPTDRLWRSFNEVQSWAQGEMLLQRFEKVNEKLLPWLDKPKDEPFFLYLHALDTHFPHEMIPPFDQWLDKNYDASVLSPKWYGQAYVRADKAPFSDADKDWLRGLYDGGILDVDTQLGRVFEKLDALHLTDNTIIVVSADHGQLLGEDGITVAHLGSTDEVLHTPLIIAGPGIPAGKRVAAMTENTDIVPTLMSLLNLSTTAKPDGKDLMPLIRGEVDAVRDYIVSIPNRGTYDHPSSFTLRDANFKFEQPFGLYNEAQLWQLPDDAATRNDVIAEHPTEAELLRGKMLNEVIPRWQRYIDLPVAAIVLDAAWLAFNVTPKGYIADSFFIKDPGVSDVLCRDNLWAYSEGQLWCRPSQEDAPPLKLETFIPPGRYDVRVAVLNDSNYKGEPASKIRAKVGREGAWQEVLAADLAPEQSAYQLISLGFHEVPDGLLRIAFDKGDKNHWATVHAFVLAPVIDDKVNEAELKQYFELETPEGRAHTDEAMDSLGYLTKD